MQRVRLVSFFTNLLSLTALFLAMVAVQGQSNTPPIITAIGDQITSQNIGITNIFFFVSDAETSPSNLVVTASSSDTNLVPNANLNIAETSTNRLLTIKPAATS